MEKTLDQRGCDLLFWNARTHNHWLDRPVANETLRELYDLCKMAPTSANCQPMRVVFLTTPEAKERLRPALMEANVEKTMKAPVTAIIAYDYDFPSHLPRLFPHTDAQSWFADNRPLIESTAFRNGSLQGGYFILAARAVGLDCGPMSGFDTAMVDQTFFADTDIHANFLCNLGYGNTSQLFPRSPRPSFDDFCTIL